MRHAAAHEKQTTSEFVNVRRQKQYLYQRIGKKNISAAVNLGMYIIEAD
jgi:hypothetical protein